MTVMDWECAVRKVIVEGDEDELFLTLAALADWMEEQNRDAEVLRLIVQERKRPEYYDRLPLPYTWSVARDRQPSSLGIGREGMDKLTRGTPWDRSAGIPLNGYLVDFKTMADAYLGAAGL